MVCITVVAYLLLLSGDVETNPGPQCEFSILLYGHWTATINFVIVDLVSDNLGQLLDLLYDACHKWYNLGMTLGIKEAKLEIIRSNWPRDEEACFREMLSEWLKTTDPDPSWEGLIAALKQHCVGSKKLADKVREELGIPKDSYVEAEDVLEKGWLDTCIIDFCSSKLLFFRLLCLKTKT